MKEKRKADEVSQVQDKPTEVWIKLLFAMTSFAVILLGYMGDRFINNQDELIKGQNRTTEEVGKINGNLQTYGSRISRTESDVKEIRSTVSDHSKRIYKLERKK